MYRTSRDTGKWFDNDNKGAIKDKKYIGAMSPGNYNPHNQPLGDKKKIISWNFGSVPFGNCQDRFKSEMRTLPGPGQYERDVLQLTKPVPVKRASPRTSPALDGSHSRTFQQSPGGSASGDLSMTTIKKPLTIKQ